MIVDVLYKLAISPSEASKVLLDLILGVSELGGQQDSAAHEHLLTDTYGGIIVF